MTIRNRHIDFSVWQEKELSNPDNARRYLQIAIEEYEVDHDTEAFLLAVRDVAQAQGGIGQLSHKTGLNRQSLYKALSSKGNPRLDTLVTILYALGFKLSIQ